MALSDTAAQTFWGLTLVSLSCFVSATGLVLLKFSAARKGKRWLWIAGLCCIVALPIPLNAAAYSLVPLSLAAPFGGLTIVFSLFLARFLPEDLREPFHKRKLAAVFVLLAGVVLVCLYGPPDVTDDVDPLIFLHDAGSNWSFMILALICVGEIVATGFLVMLPRTRHRAAGSSWGVVAVSFSAASCGGFATLLLKLVSELGVRIAQHKQYIDPVAAVIIVTSLAFFAPYELFQLNSLIAGSPVTFAVPLYESLLIVLNVTLGGAFFKELQVLESYFGFTTGVLLVGIGVCALSADHGSTPDPEKPPNLEVTASLIEAIEEGRVHSAKMSAVRSLVVGSG